ncbi:AraC family transcriptional regulator [Paenibacillus sinopodophylli]|uniref:AraC family transcriptional regulator n=1 Tax=Paenibacillus sinopodophylli TaxID=1837342 RepID=UPI00110CC127|nr:AraC family transcriptional regulator [Paenibacillus sinopodophylli]
MYDMKKYCEYLYHFLHFPVYLFADKELIACYPSEDIVPPAAYLDQLWEVEINVTYIITPFYTYYGCVRIQNSSSCIVLGPISDLPYTREILNGMLKEHAIELSKADPFFSFFYKIPAENIDTFINSLLFINYTLNRTELIREDIEHPVDIQLYRTIQQKYAEISVMIKEEGIFNNNYLIEKEFFRLIETGNIEGLKKFSEQELNTNMGIHADNNLRNLKNMFIITVTLTARAAIRGGLTPSIAYQLSDNYIQQVERLTDMHAIGTLFAHVYLDYANRTAHSLLPPDADHVLRQVVTYVRENTNRNVTVIEVASHVGYNRSYLSRKMKAELGLDLSTFIRNCKLEEAKGLLAHSSKTISEISSFLCFSSQSHFQKAFKNLYGITPQAYRRST